MATWLGWWIGMEYDPDLKVVVYRGYLCSQVELILYSGVQCTTE